MTDSPPQPPPAAPSTVDTTPQFVVGVATLGLAFGAAALVSAGVVRGVVILTVVLAGMCVYFAYRFKGTRRWASIVGSVVLVSVTLVLIILDPIATDTNVSSADAPTSGNTTVAPPRPTITSDVEQTTAASDSSESTSAPPPQQLSLRPMEVLTLRVGSSATGFGGDVNLAPANSVLYPTGFGIYFSSGNKSCDGFLRLAKSTWIPGYADRAESFYSLLLTSVAAGEATVEVREVSEADYIDAGRTSCY